jgi:transposase InsO family protein
VGGGDHGAQPDARTHAAVAARHARAVPFKIFGFHPDGGTEYVNYEVAKMLEEERIELTRLRPRQCNDNALAESKNGNVVRRQFGYSYIPAERAILFNDFCKAYLNPFLNLHRPCLFGTEVPDLKKPGRLRRIHRHEDVMTPLEKLASLPDASSFLRTWDPAPLCVRTPSGSSRAMLAWRLHSAVRIEG